MGQQYHKSVLLASSNISIISARAYRKDSRGEIFLLPSPVENSKASYTPLYWRKI